MEGIQGVWRFSAKAGCQKLVIESKVLYASAMAMVVLAHFSLKVGISAPSPVLYVTPSSNILPMHCLNLRSSTHGMLQNFGLSGIAKRIAASGYAIYAVDYPGFGLSEGLHGYIPNFDELVGDVIEQFTNVKGMKLLNLDSSDIVHNIGFANFFELIATPGRSDVKGLPFFVMGESMGGAVSLKIHLKEPDKWDGVILVAPMCKVSSFSLIWFFN